jgi:hypothetical protein
LSVLKPDYLLGGLSRGWNSVPLKLANQSLFKCLAYFTKDKIYGWRYLGWDNQVRTFKELHNENGYLYSLTSKDSWPTPQIVLLMDEREKYSEKYNNYYNKASPSAKYNNRENLSKNYNNNRGKYNWQ